MNKKNKPGAPDASTIETLLTKIQPVPSETFHEQMSKAVWRGREGQEAKAIAVSHRPRIAVVIMILLVVTTLLFTPQGRAFAQKVFLFFTVTEKKSFPIPTEQVFAMPGTETPLPTYVLPLAPVEVSTAIPAPTVSDQSCSSPEGKAGYFCQIRIAEEQAGFDAKELSYDPKGMKFSQAVFNSDTKAIDMEFVAMSGGGYLYLRQGLGEFPETSQWGEVPSDAIKQVTVNGQYAELVSGTFVVYPNTTEAVWQPGGMMRLHWLDGDRWFSLEKMGDPYPIEWLGERELIELAESLVDGRSLDQAPQVDPENLTSVDAAEELAGFDVPAPTLLPKGHELKRVAWRDGVVHLLYGPKNSPEAALMISVGPIANSPVGPCLECPPDAVEEVQVGPWQAWYLRGAFNMGPGSNVDPTPTPVWEPDARHWGLSWNTDTLWFSISYFSSSGGGGEMNKETLIQIAESIR